MSPTKSTEHPMTFGAFSIDQKDLVLRCDGVICEELTEIDIRVLLCLAAHPGQVVSKDDLITDAWGDKEVDETNLNVRIRNIRQVIGDPAIRNLRGRGYIFEPEKAVSADARVRHGSSVEASVPQPAASAPAVGPSPSDDRGLAAEARVRPWYSRRPRKTSLWASAIAAAAMLGAMTFGMARRSADDMDLDFLYHEFLRDGGSMVVSNPRVYRYVNAGEGPAIKRHGPLLSNALAPDRDGSTREITASAAQYTGIGETLTALRLSALFNNAGAGNKLEVGQSDGPPDAQRHMILLGGWGSNPLSAAIVGNLERNRVWEAFHRRLPLRLHHGAAYRLAAEGGEVPICTPEYGVGGRDSELVPIMECALITKVKEPFAEKARLVVAGINSQGTEAAGRLVTDQRSRLREWLTARFGSAPTAFQVLFKVPVHRDTAQPGTNFMLVDAVNLTP